MHDVRSKVPAETWCVLEAEKRATGRDHSEIIRDVLHGWASQRLHAASVLQRLLAVEGIDGKPREP